MGKPVSSPPVSTGLNLAIVSTGDGFLVRQALEVAALSGYANVTCCEDVTLAKDADRVFLALDEEDLRKAALRDLPVGQRVNLIHPMAFVSSSAVLGDNVYVGAQAVIGMAAQVGNGVVLNALSAVEHDNQIGAFTLLGTGAILCGHVTTGEAAFIGGGATVKPGCSIGAGTTIGTGAVVVRDCDGGAVYVGNPARKLG